jgi:hypothetical protein
MESLTKPLSLMIIRKSFLGEKRQLEYGGRHGK